MGVSCNVMKQASLKEIDSLDIDFVCKAIEDSFKIRFAQNELSNVSNLGDLCDLTASKIEFENSETCTNQEAFYKIRNIFAETLKCDKNSINPKTQISEILPRKNRIKNVKLIEKKIGFKLNTLQPPTWIIGILVISLIIGIVYLFINTFIGIVIIGIAYLLIQIANENGKELKTTNFRELTENAVLNNYAKSRKQIKTYNKNEVEKIVLGLFTNLLDFPKNELTRQTEF